MPHNLKDILKIQFFWWFQLKEYQNLYFFPQKAKQNLLELPQKPLYSSHITSRSTRNSSAAAHTKNWKLQVSLLVFSDPWLVRLLQDEYSFAICWDRQAPTPHPTKVITASQTERKLFSTVPAYLNLDPSFSPSNLCHQRNYDLSFFYQISLSPSAQGGWWREVFSVLQLLRGATFKFIGPFPQLLVIYYVINHK